MLLLCGLFFYPYPSGSWPSLAIDGYLRGVAQVSGWLIGRFVNGVDVQGTQITGPFPLQIVKACSLLDAQAFYVGAALAFPADKLRKLVGVALGVLVLATLNVLRIAALFYIGLYAPERFDVVHEEWLPAALVVAACLIFAGFVAWTTRVERAQPV